MSLILQTIADGLVLGGLYSLAAVGFSLILGVMSVVNLSHGVLVLIGAYISYTLWHVFDPAQHGRAVRVRLRLSARHHPAGGRPVVPARLDAGDLRHCAGAAQHPG